MKTPIEWMRKSSCVQIFLGRRAALPVLFLALGWSWDVAAAETKERPVLDGTTWKWVFTMRDGSRVEPKAKLKQKGDTITGVTLMRGVQPIPITKGTLQGDTVQWTVVREHDGRKVTTLYQGKLVGDTLTGFIESDWTGEPQRYQWEAERAPVTPAGTWRWASGRRPPAGETNGTNRTARTIDTKGMFTHQAEKAGGEKAGGEKVGGKVTYAGRDLEVKHGRFRSGELTFQTVREREGEKIVVTYRGKIEGETLKGFIETDTGREVRTRAWEATRVED
jgi:hypothetical protein